MKGGYIVALLMIVLMVGCATTQPEAAPETPAAAPEAPPAAPAAPAEVVAPEAPAAEEAETELTDAQKAHIESLKASCERGVVNLCLVLKNMYGIEWPPEVAEEPETTEEPKAAEGTTE